MKKKVILLSSLFCLASCSSGPNQPLTGYDTVDLTTNKWLHQINMRDHFFCFEDNGEGWEAEVANSAQQWHGFFSKEKFNYTVDTIGKVIHLVYDKNEDRKAFAYELSFEDGVRNLKLNGTDYIDATLELNQFYSKVLE